MKINEKNLCMFATTPPVDLEGWLNKRGEINKSWQRRYFVLKGNLLFYFDKKREKEPLGVIILEGCTIELAEGEIDQHYCFHIAFHGVNNRTYLLSAESQDVMEQWMKALTCAGYEYIKLMVADLQRQLDELEMSEACRTPERLPIAPKPPPRRQNPFNKQNRSTGLPIESSSSLIDGHNHNGDGTLNSTINNSESIGTIRIENQPINESSVTEDNQSYRKAVDVVSEISKGMPSTGNISIADVAQEKTLFEMAYDLFAQEMMEDIGRRVPEASLIEF